MEEQLKFVYKKEYWLQSAFINSNKIKINQKVSEIKNLVEKKIKNLTKDDLGKIKWNESWMLEVIEMGKNISIECNWISFIEYFPYYDENTALQYNTLGYFEFEVEYFKNEPNMKNSIKPVLIQQIPSIVKEEIKQYCQLIDNQYLFLDEESPIFIFATSDNTKPLEIKWSEDNINKYKKELGNWIEIYSGSWPDYNDSLYNKRIQNNLSNRLSELHFIHRNSAFVYMNEENFKLHFEGYMRDYVLKPIPQIRAMVFALMSINSSLDILFIRENYQSTMDLKKMEERIRNLKYLRGMIQTQMSVIYNELDYNRRQHYTSVLNHLIDEFNLREIIDRINKKFEIIYDSIQMIYQQKNEDNQARTERGMNLLSIFFSLGIGADLAGLISNLVSATTPYNLSFWVDIIVTIIISTMLLGTLCFFVWLKRKSTKKFTKNAVDAVIIDGKGNVVLIKRKYPPFKGKLALPGGLIEFDETSRQALIREVKEETNIDVKIEKQIGIYDDESRDPRGPVISTAFLCSIVGAFSKSEIKGGDDAIEAKFIPINDLENRDLAFDHENILRDALNAAKSIEKFKDVFSKEN